MSARTLAVGPVSPRSDFFVTDLPHPLGGISRHLIIVGMILDLPLVEAVDFDTLGCKSRKEIAVGVDMV